MNPRRLAVLFVLSALLIVVPLSVRPRAGPVALDQVRAASPTAGSVCPPVNDDTTCGTIITITDTGISVTSTGQGPYDGSDDTLVGVINNSSKTISSIGINSGSDIFNFDGDGIVTYGIAGNAKDSSGYGGPNAYFTNINAAQTAGAVIFITPIAANGGTSYFSLEDAISSAHSCADLINNGLKNPTVNGANVDTTFTPNQTVAGIGPITPQATATQFCGFTNFDWVQTITHQDNPSAFYARNTGGAFDKAVSGQVNLTSTRAPWSDPPQGGGYTAPASPDPGDFSYPFYYDPKTSDLANHETTTTLKFHDAPADPCLPGGSKANTPACNNTAEPAGSQGGYTTHLAGVNADGTATDLGIGFTWTSNYNGSTGGSAIKKTDLPADPGGTGGATITNVQEITNYQYNGVAVTTVNGAPVTGTPTPGATPTPTPGVPVSYTAGWNLVGGPAGTVMTGALNPLYTFQAGDSNYETSAPSAPLQSPRGYWAYFPAATTVNLPVVTAQTTTVTLPANQFIQVGNPTDGAVSISGADMIDTFSTATNSYTSASGTVTLQPGQGAWVFSKAGGTLTMTPATSTGSTRGR